MLWYNMGNSFAFALYVPSHVQSKPTDGALFLASVTSSLALQFHSRSVKHFGTIHEPDSLAYFAQLTKNSNSGLE